MDSLEFHRKKLLLDDIGKESSEVNKLKIRLMRIFERSKAYDYETSEQALYIVKDRMDEIIRILNELNSQI